jgi:hypothetical protein
MLETKGVVMRLVLAIVFVMASVLAFAAPANAASFEIGAKIGIAMPSDLDQATPGPDENDSSTMNYGVLAQFDVNDNWAVRLDIEMGSSEYCGTMAFMLSGVYYFPMGEDTTWMPYGRIGVGALNVDFDWTGAPDSETEFAYEGAIGLSYTMEEWRFFFEIGYRGCTFEITGVDFDMSGFIAALGFTYRF